MKKKHQTLLGILIFAVLASIFFYFSYVIKLNKTKKIEHYFVNFDIKLKGVVIEIDSLTQTLFKPGLICLKVISSNYEEYDQQDSLSEYFLLQRDSFVVFYDSGDLRGIHFYEIGDTVNINGVDRKITCIDKYGSQKFNKNITLQERFFCPYDKFSELLQKCKERE